MAFREHRHGFPVLSEAHHGPAAGRNSGGGSSHERVLSGGMVVAQPEDRDGRAMPEDRYALGLDTLFAASVRRHAGRQAIDGSDRSYRYEELGALAEQVGRGLRRLGLPAGALVGVAGRHGPDACVAMLGAIRAGLGYVPLDPALSLEQQATLIADSGARAVVRLPGVTTVGGGAVDFVDLPAAGEEAGDGCPAPSRPAGPASVMFTPGSDGRPKAVALPHRTLIQLSLGSGFLGNGFLDIRSTDRVLHAASLSSGTSVLEIWPALLSGACLVPVTSDVLCSGPALRAMLRWQRITVLFLPTRVFHELSTERPEMFAGLRYLLVGGEPLRADAVRRVLSRGRPQHLVNLYGSTEGGVVTAAHDVTEAPSGSGAVPIGRPLPDTVCVVRREDGSLAPAGEEGELWVAGGGGSPGYLNDPEESDRRFGVLTIGGKSRRFFRTGDIARRRADSVLELRGRGDGPTASRESHVDLGEIRAVLATHPAVDAVIVLGLESLVAYVVTGAEEAPAPEELLSFLRERLPGHLVPATVTVIPRLRTASWITYRPEPVTRPARQSAPLALPFPRSAGTASTRHPGDSPVSKYLEPVTVPDPAELAALQQLADLADPYRADEEADELFVLAMNESNTWHAARSPFFSQLWDRRRLASIADLAHQPLVHANFFKKHKVLSVTEEQIALHATSSGTTGQKSQMFFDEWTLRNGQRMVARIFQHYGWIDTEPVNYLLYSYQPRPGMNLGTSFTDDYLCDFAPARSVEYGLPNTGSGHEFDVFGCVRALLRFAEEGAPVRILGFPAFLSFTLDRMRDLGIGPVQLNERSLISFGGGWKGNADKQIGKEELYARIVEQLGIPDERIRDGYGAVEHSVLYMECPRHHLHVPTWSRVLIRSVRNLEPLPLGEVGYLQFVSPYITSAPAQSVLMGDLASLHAPQECGCGLPTPWFVVHGRAGTTRNRSCAIAAAELLEGRS
nr:AMP-binding protein [Amycolatopsis sp. SID8362]